VNVLGPWHRFALVLLTVHGDTASGQFLAQTGGFMPRRTDPARAHDYAIAVPRNAADPADGYTALDPQTLYADSTFGLIAQTRVAGVVSRLIYVDDEENLGTELAVADGASWALVHHARDGERGYRTVQAGPRRLWDEIEALHRVWLAHDRPRADRFGITVGGGSTRCLWLDHADDGHAWESTAPN
jgi:hypothetical protein